jgi:hypothetical protein
MSEVRRLCEAGLYPRQHLWGADALAAAGHRVEWGPFGGSEPLGRLSRVTRGKLGSLAEEWALARAADSATLVYSGDQNLTRGMAWLGRWRLASVFHSIEPGRGGAWVRRVDVAFALSARTRDVLVESFGRDASATHLVSWGPDLDYRGYEGGGSFEVVVSAGKTGRDLGTLRAALDLAGLPSRVYALEPGEGPRDLNAVLDDMRRASVVAIPLADPSRLLGLSEFGDAVALGKPVVMTRSPHFDFDIEALGFGLWVDRGDVAGMAAALESIAHDVGKAAAMGARARAWAQREWNYERFCSQIVEALSSDPPIRWVN